MKINVKCWKIKMKSTNLTQINLRNDPINRRIQSFSFRNFEDEVWCSRLDFSLVFWLKLKTMHLMEAELKYDHAGTNGTRKEFVNKENFMFDRGPFFRREESSFIWAKLNFSRRMGRLITMDGFDRACLIETTSWISYIGFRSYDVDLIWCPSVEINLDRYNGCDQRSGFVHLSEHLCTWWFDDRVDRASTRSTPFDQREDDPMLDITPRHLKLDWKK